MKKSQNSTENTYDKQISELNEENKKQAQEIANLEKKNAKLQKQIDGTSDTETETEKDANKTES